MTVKRPLFLPATITSKKRNAMAVQQTQSPKRATEHQESKHISPCVLGIQRGAQIMKQGQVLAIPTETVYALCTCVRLDKIDNGIRQCKFVALSHNIYYLVDSLYKTHSHSIIYHLCMHTYIYIYIYIIITTISTSTLVNQLNTYSNYLGTFCFKH